MAKHAHQLDLSLNQLRAFMAVARKGNLSAAATELGTNQSNLGRQMASLAKEIGMELFVRHSRGMNLTQQGKEFFEVCQDTVGQIVQKTNSIREKDREPEGQFHLLSGTGVLGAIMDNIAPFLKKFPKLSFQFSPVINPCQLHIVNAYQLQNGEADAGIIPDFQSALDVDFIQRHLYDTAMRVYASPLYFNNHPLPKVLEDLRFHKLILFTGEKQLEVLNQPLFNKKTRDLLTPILSVATTPAMRMALVNGLGIGSYAYDRELIEKGLLIDVFPSLPDQIISYNYIYHRRLEGSPKIEAFYEFLKEITKVWEPPERKLH